MRVVHLSFSDAVGGAARGSYALHKALVARGVDSWMLVEDKTVEDDRVLGDDGRISRAMRSTRHRLDGVALRPYRDRNRAIFSPSLAPSRIVSRVHALNPDVVHLHWVAASFVLPEHVPRFGLPVVWSIRDMEPFTGGCHVAYDCLRYRDTCGKCPHLGSHRERDLSRLTWLRKRRAWIGAELYPVGISSWIRDQAQRSSLFAERKVELIENAIDVEFWSATSREQARLDLGIPDGRIVLLFSSWFLDDHRKGFDTFRDVCWSLSKTNPGRFHALVIGTMPADGDTDLGLESTFRGHLSDDEAIRQAYSAADATILPSRAEPFGKVAAESLACGTPCIVFDGTGLASVVKHERTGYVAAQGDVGDLIAGVKWVCQDPDRWSQLSAAGRRTAVRRFSVATQARRYVALYRAVTGLAGPDADST